MGMRPSKDENADLKGLNINPQDKRLSSGKVVTYYRYRHPLTKKYHSLGTDRRKAIASARLLNDRLLPDVDAVEEIANSAEDIRTWNDLLDDFKKEYPKWHDGSWAKRTQAEHDYRINKYRADLGGKDFSKYKLKALNKYIKDEFIGDGRIQNRNLLIHIYKYAVSVEDAEKNLASETLPPVKSKRVRMRLSEDMSEYNAIHAVAPEYVRTAMDLSLNTLQENQDIVQMGEHCIKDGWMYIVRHKTHTKTDKAYIKLFIFPELQAVIDSCLPFNKYYVQAEAGKQLTSRELTKAFAKARKAAGVFEHLDSNKKPTFKEIRSLGGRLLKKKLIAAGIEEETAEATVQALMGHTTRKMTNIYLDDDHRKWNEVVIKSV